MSESPESMLLTEIDDRGVATVTLNRADKHNAFDDAVIAELDSSFARLAQDSAVRIVILASTGKSFSAGADLAWMQRMASYDREQNLADARAHRASVLAQLAVVHRNVAPAKKLQPLLLNDAFDQRAALCLGLFLGRQEHHAHTVVAGTGQGHSQPSALTLKEFVGHLDQDAGSVAGFRVSPTGAPVSQV